MSYCTPCPPCDTNFPLLCEPLETTTNGKRLVVEDSAACQKTIQTPVAQQVLKTDGAGNLTWTNGVNNTVLGKDSTGKVEFATLNSVLQVVPVDLGSQPLTTTGTLSSGAITTTSVTATGAVNGASVTATGAVNGASAIITGNVGIGTSTPDAPLEVNVSSGGVDGNYRSSVLGISNTNQGQLEIRHGASTGLLNSRWSSLQAWSNGLTNPVPLLLNKDGGNVGIGTSTLDSNAILELNSTTQGFLPPKMTTTQKNAIFTPPSGLVVYDTTTNKLCVYNGTSWIDLH
jgi:hypothetical protein